MNLETGKVETTFEPDEKTYWFHQRCHPQKATEKYILTSRTGIEYVDPETKHWDPNHWVRGACLYGVMPANGLMYSPSNPCACYMEAKLNGLCALSGALSSEPDLKKESAKSRLEKAQPIMTPLRIIPVPRTGLPTGMTTNAAVIRLPKCLRN